MSKTILQCMKKTENVIDSWKQDRPWLHHYVEQNVMVCNWCIIANGPKELSFVKGCDNFKISAIKDHELCKFHLKIAPRYTTPVEESPAAVYKTTKSK